MIKLRASESVGVGEYPKAVVALAGARDHYQLPLALHEGNLLHSLITDLYWPIDRKWFAASLGRFISKELIAKRFCQGLSSRKVRISTSALSAFTLAKIVPSLAVDWYKGRTLGRKAGQIALRENAALFCYSTYAAEAFKGDGSLPRYRFLFQLHPHPKSVYKLLKEEMDLVPQGSASLKMEWELSLPSKQLQELCSETQLANGWVVASSFTANTLVEHGVPQAHVHVVPYGVNFQAYRKRARLPVASKPFTAIYVGSLIQRKGLSYFLDAVRLLGTSHLRVVLCGRGLIDHKLLAHYSDLNVEVRIGLPTHQLVREVHESDVLVLPSLAEGFAHVILEMMACGLPVITTPNTCAPDVMVNGKHGFILPIRNAEAIAEKLAWGLDHRADLAAMGESAAQQARTFTWERFRAGVRAAYKEMIVATDR
jgi:glycosyltransferase involved in cell wall biosynthesis